VSGAKPLTSDVQESPISGRRLGRRQYIKYSGAAIAGAVVAGLGYYATRSSSTETQPDSTQTETSSLDLSVPTADFKCEPGYINATSADDVCFMNTSCNGVDADITYAWYVDDRMVADTKDYCTRLASNAIGTPHKVRLSACRGGQCSNVEKVIEVDPHEIYQPTELKVPIKSIVYDTGIQYKHMKWDSTRYWLSENEFEIELRDIISQELGCNAVRLTGSNCEDLFKIAEIAIDSAHFDSILVNPRFPDCTCEEVLERIGQFANRAEQLRERHGGIVFSVGNELAVETIGIGSDLPRYTDRVSAKWYNDWKTRLNAFLEQLTSTVSEIFKGDLTYASGYWEHPIDWVGLGMRIISVNQYTDESRTILDIKRQLRDLNSYAKSRHKQLWVSEFGCATFEGALEFGGLAWTQKGRQYSQEAQADGIEKYLQVFNEVQPDACTLHQFWEWNEDDSVSFAITKFRRSAPPQRKKGFYMYKSYRRTS
jgi:hypothetical protein